MIVMEKGKFVIKSETGKKLGTFNTLEEAEKRLAQIEMWKHIKEGTKK